MNDLRRKGFAKQVVVKIKFFREHLAGLDTREYDYLHYTQILKLYRIFLAYIVLLDRKIPSITDNTSLRVRSISEVTNEEILLTWRRLETGSRGDNLSHLFGKLEQIRKMFPSAPTSSK